jgi:HTH-type transcriptional regulator/antitoxin HigA
MRQSYHSSQVRPALGLSNLAKAEIPKVAESAATYKTKSDTHHSTYEELIRQFPLRPITTDEQNDRAADFCDTLTDRINDLNKDEEDYLEVLTLLIIQYESKWDDETPRHTPRERLEYLMEVNHLAQKDLVKEFGSASRVSDFLNGRRAELSKDQAKALAKRFKMRVEAFLG